MNESGAPAEPLMFIVLLRNASQGLPQPKDCMANDYACSLDIVNARQPSTDLDIYSWCPIRARVSIYLYIAMIYKLFPNTVEE